jgi:signal peptidase II
MKQNPRSARIVLGALCVLAAFSLDQITKTLIVEIIMQPPRVIYITNFLNITLGYNEGISFGLFSETFRQRPLLLIYLSSAIALTILIWMILATHRVETAALGLLAGGAAGNIYDRIERGRVTDFIDFHIGSWHWPAFNIADVAVVSGALLLIFASFLQTRT